LGCRFKYDADVVRGVLFPVPEPVADVEDTVVAGAMDVDGDGGVKAKANGASGGGHGDDEREDGSEREEAGPPRKRRRVSGLEEVYAAALGEGPDASVREEDEKMVVEGGEGTPTPKEQDEPIVEKEAEEPLKTRTNGVENEKEKTTVKKPAEIIKPRDVHFAMKDGRMLVFSPSPPAVPPFDAPTETAPAPLGSNSDLSEQLRWDVARAGKDGTREVLYRGLGADEVHLEEGGVKFRVAPSPLTEAKDAGDVGGATIPLNEDTKAPWGEHVDVVLWRYAS
jgi:hypothetical protein